MAYVKEERETIFQTDDMMKTWNVYTRQRKVITKLLKLTEFVELDRLVGENGNIIELTGVIPFKNISIRNNRVYNEKQKQELRDRLNKNKNKE